jgi:hypothetical protein
VPWLALRCTSLSMGLARSEGHPPRGTKRRKRCRSWKPWEIMQQGKPPSRRSSTPEFRGVSGATSGPLTQPLRSGGFGLFLCVEVLSMSGSSCIKPRCFPGDLARWPTSCSHPWGVPSGAHAVLRSRFLGRPGRGLLSWFDIFLVATGTASISGQARTSSPPKHNSRPMC